jgi:transposase-like protein
LHGWSRRKYQKYRCKSCGHRFFKIRVIGMYTIKIIEYVTYMYLRSMSFNQVNAILRAFYQRNVFTKAQLIGHIEELTDRVPDHQAVSRWLKPKRSGYYALDGTWLKYRGEDIVLLILFDVETLDTVAYHVADDETEESYTALIKLAWPEISVGMKGLFGDGDTGLMAAIAKLFPCVPFQLCVFHKYARIGQLIPFRYTKSKLDLQIKERVEKVLFAESKDDATSALHELELFARENQGYGKLNKAIEVLHYNFELLLTHFDHPEMSPYNNVLEGFNGVLKRRILLMKGFKKDINIDRWIKLLILDWRFHVLKESAFESRRGRMPFELAGVELPEIFNWLTFVRKNYKKSP